MDEYSGSFRLMCPAIVIMRQLKLVLPLIVLTVAIAGCASDKTIPKSLSISKETEARQVVNSILFDQRTHYIGNQTFTMSKSYLEELNPSIKSPNYNYKVISKPNRREGIVVTAIPKHAELRSFTGVIFAVPVGNEKQTFSEICETTNPSRKPPAAPPIPARAEEQIKCPTGSRSAFAVLVNQ